MVCYNLPLGLGTALSIRLGSLLPVNVPRSKQLVYWCSLGSFAFFCVLCTGVYVIRDSIFAIFTKDPLVLAEVEKIWWKVVAYYLLSVPLGS
jgi:Na+-driven multidrug efflux pump